MATNASLIPADVIQFVDTAITYAAASGSVGSTYQEGRQNDDGTFDGKSVTVERIAQGRHSHAAGFRVVAASLDLAPYIGLVRSREGNTGQYHSHSRPSHRAI